MQELSRADQAISVVSSNERLAARLLGDEKITTQCVPFCLRPQQEDKCHVSPLSTYRIYFPHLPNIVPSQLDNRALLADRANLVWYGLALVATVSQWMFNYNYMTSQSAHGDRLTNVEQAITLLPDQLAVLRKTLQTYELSVEQTKRALNSIQTELNLQRSQIGATTKDAEQALVEAKVGQHISTELAAVQASAKTTQETVHSMMKDMEKLDAAIGALERKQSELQAKAFSVPVLAPYNTPLEVLAKPRLSFIAILPTASPLPKNSLILALSNQLAQTPQGVASALSSGSVELVVVRHASSELFKNSFASHVSIITAEDSSYGVQLKMGIESASGSIVTLISSDIILEGHDVLNELQRVANRTITSMSQRPLALALTSSISQNGLEFFGLDYALEKHPFEDTNIVLPVKASAILPEGQKISSDEPRWVKSASPHFLAIRRDTLKKLALREALHSPQLLVADIVLQLEELSSSPLWCENIGLEIESSHLEYYENSDLKIWSSKWGNKLQKYIESNQVLPLSVMWDTYCGCTGWNIEVINYATALEKDLDMHLVAGEGCFCPGFPEYTTDALERMRTTKVTNIDVWISHKPPDRYPIFPYNGLVTYSERPNYVIGRSMIECDELPWDWAKYVEDRVDEVWVPSTFLLDVFEKGGVQRDILHQIPLSIDTKRLWNPAYHQPLKLPMRSTPNYAFLSIFKWEHRKGWDVLLEAYFNEFSPTDDVVLYIHTYLYLEAEPRNESRIRQIIVDYAKDKFKLSVGQLPSFVVLVDEMKESDMPKLYKAVDAYVMPSRGEGWGLPALEAMSMELPVIATNWSGPADFVTEESGFPLRVDKLGSSPGSPFPGQLAEPSVAHLRQLMRYLQRNPNEGRQVGQRARQFVQSRYDNTVVAKQITKRLGEIQRAQKAKLDRNKF